MHGRLFAFTTLVAAVLSLSTAGSATETSATAGPTQLSEKSLTGDAAVPPQSGVQLLAQAKCFGSIPSCRAISSTQQCHATEKVIYTLQSGQWCKTPVTCKC